MTLVKNLNKTKDRTPPKGYNSWKEWWEDQKSREFSTCSCENCTADAEVGAHVQKSGVSDMKWYIVPLCKPCNNKSSDDIFKVRDNDLAAIN